MNIIKASEWNDIPEDYTGIVKWEDGSVIHHKNGRRHREDGPSFVEPGGYKAWWLDGNHIWDLDPDSDGKLDLTNQIILSKNQHPEYPTVQVWKILDKDEVYERIIIPGMEEFITE